MLCCDFYHPWLGSVELNAWVYWSLQSWHGLHLLTLWIRIPTLEVCLQFSLRNCQHIYIYMTCSESASIAYIFGTDSVNGSKISLTHLDAVLISWKISAILLILRVDAYYSYLDDASWLTVCMTLVIMATMAAVWSRTGDAIDSLRLSWQLKRPHLKRHVYHRQHSHDYVLPGLGGTSWR